MTTLRTERNDDGEIVTLSTDGSTFTVTLSTYRESSRRFKEVARGKKIFTVETEARKYFSDLDNCNIPEARA